MELDHIISSLNSNKFFAALMMIVFNIGSKYIVLDISTNQEMLLKNAIFRKLTLFCVFFIGCRDVMTSFVMTVLFTIITKTFLNQESLLYLFPYMKTKSTHSKEEYEMAKKVISKYEADLQKDM
jgi:hypothetical protein